MSRSDLVDVECRMAYQTDKAWCVTTGKKDASGHLVKYWCPKSQCEWMEADGIMVMPRWLCEEKGLDNDIKVS